MTGGREVGGGEATAFRPDLMALEVWRRVFTVNAGAVIWEPRGQGAWKPKLKGSSVAGAELHGSPTACQSSRDTQSALT